LPLLSFWLSTQRQYEEKLPTDFSACQI